LALDSLTSVMTSMSKAERVNHRAVFETAARESLTFYDASYLCAAEATHEKLVTDDEDLYDVAKKRLRALKSADVPLTKPELQLKETESKKGSSEERRRIMREGREENRKHEEDLERRYLP
jgi:hypothetical protein